MLTLSCALRLEVNVAIIAAAIPALRPLWATTAHQNQQNGGQLQRADSRRRLNSTYVMMMDQPDSYPSRLETCITA